MKTSKMLDGYPQRSCASTPPDLSPRHSPPSNRPCPSVSVRVCPCGSSAVPVFTRNRRRPAAERLFGCSVAALAERRGCSGSRFPLTSKR